MLISQGSGNKTDQPIFSRLWGNGFLPSQYQGVRFRSGKDPVLYLNNAQGIDRACPQGNARRRQSTEPYRRISFGDPEINTRIPQYEMAYRMQTSVPGLTDLSNEPQHVLDMYGIKDNQTDGGFGATACSPAGWPNGACGLFS